LFKVLIDYKGYEPSERTRCPIRGIEPDDERLLTQYILGLRSVFRAEHEMQGSKDIDHEGVRTAFFDRKQYSDNLDIKSRNLFEKATKRYRNFDNKKMRAETTRLLQAYEIIYQTLITPNEEKMWQNISISAALLDKM
jgi:hypothetical protein